MNVSSSHFIIGDFIVENKKIGKGNFATVHKGIHKYTKQKVAIKKLDVENIFDLKKHVKREIKLHKELDHPNVVKLFDVLFDNNNHVIYFVMELCKYGNFAKFQNKRPMTEHYIHKYTKQLTNGLEYLYKNNIIHRDLKPQNLLLDEHKYLKISDFGFAKNLQNINNHNLKQTYCGSPMYMAPEILHYQNYNEKSDLWSVGIIIYEMITGYPPYHVKNFYQLVKKIESVDIKLDDKFKCKISSDLKDLVNKLLVKNPTDRISWNDYFNHNWIVKDLQLERENKLLEVSITNSSSLPMINLNKSNNPDTKIFNSMKQNSIKDNLSFSLHSSKKLNVSMGSENNFQYNNNDNSKELVNQINNLNFNGSENSFNMNQFNNDELEEDELEENELFFSITNEDDDIEIVNEKSNFGNNTNISKNLSDSDSDYIDSKELKSNSINNFNEEESFILLSNQIPFTKTKPINIPKKINNNTIDNFSIYGDTKNSSEIRKEILEAINCSSQNNDPELSFELKTSYNSIEKNDNFIKNNGKMYSKQVKSNKMFKNVYKNSMMILRESYDYLSSNNKSI